TSEAYIAHAAGGPITLSRVTYSAIAANEIVVETAATAICATDLKAAAGKFLCGPPLILGHESAGVVLTVGAAVHNLAPGDRVVLSFSSCGACGECAGGASAYCRELLALNMRGCRSDGTLAASVTESGMPVRGHFFGQSSLGRRIVARASCAVRLPSGGDEGELRVLAALGCGIQTGAGAVFNVARPAPGSSVCIFGAGSVGLAACLAARLTSPARLAVVDNSAAKLAMLPACVRDAATHLVDSSALAGGGDGEFVEKLKGLTPGGRGFDFVLDCVGSGDLVRVGHLALKSRGTIIAVGGSQDMALQVPMRDHLTKGISFRGTHQGDSVPAVSIPFMIDLWRQGKFPFDELLTFYEFDQFYQAVQDMKDGKVIKPVL
ncbi:chaperonin 10-like protein, partial [Lasiosphaeria miniovina]